MALAVATLAACALPLFFTFSLALDVERELDMTDAQLGVAITAFWVVATLASLPAGRLVDRIGAARSVHIAGALVALGSLGIATAAHSFAAFAALLAVTGLGNAFVGPGMSALVAGDVRPRRRGTVFGLQQAGPPLAAVVAGLAVPTAAATLGWRWVFGLGAAAAAVATGIVRDDHRGRAGAGAGSEPTANSGARQSEPRAFAVLLAVGGLLASCAASGLVAYVVVYASAGGLSASAAGILLAAAGIVCVATRIRLGILADRRGAARLPQMAGLMLAGTAGFALLAVGATATTVAGTMLALGVGWGWTGLYVLSAVEHGADAPGRAVGAAVTGTFAGAMLGPLLVGLLSTAASFELVWLVCGALSAGGAAAFLSARRVEATRCGAALLTKHTKEISAGTRGAR